MSQESLVRITLIALWLCLAPSLAGAKTLNVAMHGADSVTCGASNAPCRTIGRAIANALTGDTVLVGPGYYGDANQDGDFADSQDEPALLEQACECVVEIDKRITVRSRDGASATVIDARGVVRRTVAIHFASGATFQGFTVRGGMQSGVLVGGDTMKPNRVIGNVADKNLGHGFEIYADDTFVGGNRAFDNGGSGFVIESEGARLVGNAASGNGESGFVAVGAVDARISKSVASGNLGTGFSVVNADAELDSVVTVGNGLDGVYFAGTGDGRVTRSTIMGNGHAVSSNCGVNNQMGHEIVAVGNYWGRPNGPGPDPADDQCLGDGSPLDLDPVKRTENKVTLSAVK